MRLLVTGGAGFIGANFVHGAVREHDGDGARCADLCRQPRIAGAGRGRHPAGAGRHHRRRAGVDELVAEADAVVHFAAETHVDNALADPEPFLHTNVIGHVHGAGGGAPPRGAAAPHLDRRGVRRPGAGRPGSGSPSRRRTTRRARTRRPRPPPTCWCAPGCGPTVCARRSRTAPTTTGRTSTWRSSFPRQITNVLTGRRPKLYGSRRQRPRLDPRRRPQQRRVAHPGRRSDRAAHI